MTIGKEVCKKMIKEVNRQHFDESYRNHLISIDYILDVLEMKKKNEKR